MTGSSLLPATIHNNKIYFLFGKENDMEDSAKGFSDFGGKVEKNETLFSAALREGSEELTGFLGDKETLRKYIQSNGGTYSITLNDYHIHIFFLKYDSQLPFYYNQNHSFLWNKMDQKILNKSKLFEKIEIEWFSISDMIKRKKEFRNFYQALVDTLITNQKEIRFFLQKKKNLRKTKKYISIL